MHSLPKLDRIDINILSLLQRNAGLTNVNLADAVALSPSPCLQRVKRLKKPDISTATLRYLIFANCQTM